MVSLNVADYLNSWRPNELLQKVEDDAKKSKPKTETLQTLGNESEVSEVIVATEVMDEDALAAVVIMGDVVTIEDAVILVDEEITTDVLQDILDLLAVDHRLRLHQELLTPTFRLRIEDETNGVESHHRLQSVDLNPDHRLQSVAVDQDLPIGHHRRLGVDHPFPTDTDVVLQAGLHR